MVKYYFLLVILIHLIVIKLLMNVEVLQLLVMLKKKKLQKLVHIACNKRLLLLRNAHITHAVLRILAGSGLLSCRFDGVVEETLPTGTLRVSGTDFLAELGDE